MRTIGEDLRAAATADPSGTAIVADGHEVSFADLNARVDALAAGLGEHGIQPGDRVALVLPNSVDMAVAIYGVLRAGAAFSPVNPTTKHEKLARLLSHLEAAAVLTDGELNDQVSPAATEAGGVPVFADLAALQRPGEATLPKVIDQDLAAVIYTSGSTGDPKGVTLAHSNMAFVADSIVEYLEQTAADRVLCVLPLSFGYGLYQLLAGIRARSALVLEPGFGFPGRVVSLLEEQRITGFPAVPTIFTVLMSLRGLAEREFPDLRFLTNAGAPLPGPVLERVRAAFPAADFYSMYGQTECQRVCYLPPEKLATKPDSVGVAIPGTDAWVAGDDGAPLGPGEVGVLMVRGAHIMQGYWRDPETTADKLAAGRWPWERVLRTGDLFRADDDGDLYFVSRSDDIIKSRGEKVAPREVEEALHTVDGVREAAVVGVPDELLGQAVHAHVAPEPGFELDLAALAQRCTELLETHMVPKRFVIHAELPRIGAGKVDRQALAAWAEESPPPA